MQYEDSVKTYKIYRVKIAPKSKFFILSIRIETTHVIISLHIQLLDFCLTKLSEGTIGIKSGLVITLLSKSSIGVSYACTVQLKNSERTVTVVPYLLLDNFKTHNNLLLPKVEEAHAMSCI